MPVTVEIDGLGKVELDDSFAQKSAAEQEQIISQIVAQAHPEHSASSGGSGGGAPRDRNAPETYKVLERIVKQLYPHAVITSDKRTPEHNAEVGGVPNSYHVSGQGIDIDGLSSDERADLKSRMEGMGIKFDEFLYHDAGSGLHLHMASTHVPEELFSQPNEGGYVEPGTDEPDADGYRDTGTVVSTSKNPSPEAPESTGSFFGMPKDWNQFVKGLEIGAGDVVEGLGDTAGIVVNPINLMTARALGYDNYTPDFGGALRDSLGLDRGDPNNTAQRISSDVIQGMSGGLGFSGVARGGAKLASNPTLQKGLYELASTPIRDTVSGATSALAADATEAAGGGPVAQTAAAIIGGGTGYGTGSAVKAGTPEARATRFATKQAKNNPFASHDAEIVQDLVKARDTLNRSPTDPKARAPLDVKAVNSVMNGYTAQMKTLIGKLDIPEMEKIRLREAIERKHSFPQEEIDALRGTVAGDAVADAIVKTQRLKTLTPEIARNPSLLTKMGQYGSTALDLIPGIPGVTGRAVRWATKAAAGDAEAARVHAAERLLNKQRGYAKLQQMVGPSGQRESRQALWDAAEEAVTGQEAAAAQDAAVAQGLKTAKAKEAAWNFKQRTEGTAAPAPSTVSRQTDTAWNQRTKAQAAADKVKAAQVEAMWANKPADPSDPVPVNPQTTKAEMAAWDQQLKDIAARKAALEKAQSPKPEKAVPVRDALIDKAVDRGLTGSTGTRAAFKQRLGGVSDEQLDTVLTKVSEDHPEAAAEIARIKLNHPTKDKRFGSAIQPHLDAAMKELGITPAPAPKAATVTVDDAAQARLAGKTEAPKAPPATPEAPFLKPDGSIDWDAAKAADEAAGIRYNSGEGTFTNTKTGETTGGLTTSVTDEAPDELYWKQKRRPDLYDASTERRVGMATDAIGDLSKKLRPEILERIKRMPEHARDNIKLGDDARSFFDNDVELELRAAGATPEEIDAARTTFYDIATYKPYQNQAEAEARGMTRGPGRPRKAN